MNTQHGHPGLNRRSKTLALAVALALAPFATPVSAQQALGQLPRAGNVVSGGAAISYNPGQTTPIPLNQATTITQTTRGAIIEWGSFSVGANNAVTFDHQVAGGVTLNRVIGFGNGATPSNILGSINAPKGSVFLVNPAGVMFGAGSSVNVGGLVASTLNISDADFNTGVGNGHYVFNAAQPGAIDNAGTITANPNGIVALLGGQVQNQGIINAPQGTIALGAGSQITLDVGGDGLTQLAIVVGANSANGVVVANTKPGTLTADGGQVVMQAVSLGTNSFAAVVNSGLVQARSLQSRGGVIVLSSSSDTDLDIVGMSGQLDVSGTTAGVAGGSIELSGYDITINHDLYAPPGAGAGIPIPSIINSSGATGGGTISVVARDVLQVDPLSNFTADATVNGNGGNIALNGANGLYALGSFSAQGGPNGGNGGRIDTSGGGVSLDGIRINAGAPRGIAGTWTVDPYDVTIVHGSGPGTLPTNPFDPLTESTIQDGDINRALDAGTNVTIGTGAGGRAGDGNIFIDGTVTDPVTGLPLAVDIVRSSGNAPLTFRLDANASIGGENFRIRSTTGLLNVVFDSDANGTNGGQAGMLFQNASILTNGGNLSMYGQNDPVNGAATSVFNAGIRLNAVTLDTRVGGSDANGSGNILLRARASCTPGHDCQRRAIVALFDSNLFTSTGSIDVEGFNGSGLLGAPGVALDTFDAGGPGTVLGSTSGSITVVGVSSGAVGSAGLILGVANVHSTGGVIDLRGHGAVDSTDGNGAPVFNYGLDISETANVSSASGLVLLSGSSDGSGAGINVASGAVINAGSGNIVVRAHNNGSTDALVLGGTLSTSGVIDLRPGSVSAAGVLVENPDDAIALGGAMGFGVSAAELGNLSATTLILGSSIQAGAINVLAPTVYGHNLTLQTGAGIALNAALNVGAHTLALLAAGNITQTAPITAGSLLAQSSAGAVTLTSATNQVSANTLAGSAAGSFSFVNAGSVGIGNVTATGFDVAANAAAVLTGSGINGGGDVLVRALNGNMALRANVSGNNVDLVSTGIFDNTGGNSIVAAGNWQVWGNTWIGENRGGLAGNGNLPNLYGCTFGGTCGVTPSATANQFIYTVQPVATISFTDSTREYGLPNAAINYNVGGLILGDQAGNAINGNVVTAATQASNVGDYAIGGTFTSPAGYLVNVLPGVLAITPATLFYVADPFTRLYGDPNGSLTGTVTGFRLADTLSSATTGTLSFGSSATAASNVGLYAIDGSGLDATNYVFLQAPGNATALRIDPATLFYDADPLRRTVGTPNGSLDGSVSGFRNGDTQSTATTGSLQFATDAEVDSPVGTYAIDGSGLLATNYLFMQNPANAMALTIMPPLATYSLDVVRQTPVTYVYDSNFGIVGLCPATDLAAGSREQDGDTLSREWSRVRSRPNLANCVSTRQKNSCGDF